MVSTQRAVSADQQFGRLLDNALYVVDMLTWLEAVRKLLGEDPTPADWLEAGKAARVRCPSCRGSGVYQWGACVNGRMTHSGPCFRCQGTGKQGQEDFCRNRCYDNHRKVV